FPYTTLFRSYGVAVSSGQGIVDQVSAVLGLSVLAWFLRSRAVATVAAFLGIAVVAVHARGGPDTDPRAGAVRGLERGARGRRPARFAPDRLVSAQVRDNGPVSTEQSQPENPGDTA